MHLDAAAQLARQLLDTHNLQAWGFAFNRRKRALGLCRYAERRIELSVHFVQANGEARVRDTLLHEIAHALAGPAAGHGPRWKRICWELGATPRACGPAAMPAGRYQAACPRCHTRVHRYRKPSARHRYFCRRCGPERGMLAFRRVAVGQMNEQLGEPPNPDAQREL